MGLEASEPVGVGDHGQRGHRHGAYELTPPIETLVHDPDAYRRPWVAGLIPRSPYSRPFGRGTPKPTCSTAWRTASAPSVVPLVTISGD